MGLLLFINTICCVLCLCEIEGCWLIQIKKLKCGCKNDRNKQCGLRMPFACNNADASVVECSLDPLDTLNAQQANTYIFVNYKADWMPIRIRGLTKNTWLRIACLYSDKSDARLCVSRRTPDAADDIVGILHSLPASQIIGRLIPGSVPFHR